MGASRRQWFGRVAQVCVAGLAATAGGVYINYSRAWDVAPGFSFLNQRGLMLVKAVVRDLVKVTSANVDEGRIVADIDQHLSALPEGQKSDMRSLMKLLTFPPVSGQIGLQSGELASIEHPYLFLDRLKNSSINHFRIGYRFLVSVTQLHFFKYSEAWPEGYAGLPRYVERS